jgi:hypothetical protein
MRSFVGQVGSFAVLTLYLRVFCHGFVSYSPTRLLSTRTATLVRPASSLLAEQLNVAFVTGNQVRLASDTLLCIVSTMVDRKKRLTSRVKLIVKIIQMKVREIEMILSEMGAIDPDNPQESLGENRML